MTINPYLGVGQVAMGDRFVGRRDLLRLIRDSWTAPRPANLSLQGNHRMGKTSLARRAQELFGTGVPDLLVLYLSVAGYETGADVIRAVTRGTRQQASRQAGDGDPPWLAELRDIELSVHDSTEWLDLKECVEAFFGILHREHIRVAVILDEFDHAALAFRRVEFQFLRDLVSENYSVGMMALSRRSIKSIELAAVSHSTLDGVMGVRRTVGPFTDAELDELFAQASAAGVELQPLRAEILQYTGSQPYLAELLCHELIETHRAGALDLAAAWEQVEPQFADQFTRSISNLDADTGGCGSDAFYQVLTRTHLTIEKQDLSLLRRLGLTRPEGSALGLLSTEFARHVRRAVLAGEMRGWWIDRDLALRATVRERLSREWGAGWADRLPRSGGGHWHGGLGGAPIVPANRLDPLDRLDAVEIADLILAHWSIFAAHLDDDPADWKDRREALAYAREAGEQGAPLDGDLRRRAKAALDPLGGSAPVSRR